MNRSRISEELSNGRPEAPLLRALVDAAPVLLWVAEPGKGAVYLNQAWLEFTGLELARGLGRAWTEAVHSGDRELVVEAFDRALSRGEPFDLEYRLRHADGDYRWVLDRGVPSYRDDGTVGYFIGSAVDLTERIEAEQERSRLLDELEQERSHLTELFELAPALIATLRGPKFVIETANPLLLSLVEGREVIGKPVLQAFPELAGQGYLDKLEAVYRTGKPFVGNEQRLTLEGAAGDAALSHYLSFVYQPLRDSKGSVSGIFVHGIDVTESVLVRQEVERHAASAAAANRRLKFLAEASEILASTLDYRTTLDNVARLVVSSLADWCTISLIQADGAVERVSAAHRDSSKEALLDELQRSPSPVRERQPALFEVIETGKARLLTDVAGSKDGGVSPDEKLLALLDRIGVDSAVVVPLTSRETTIGAIFMARSDQETPFDEADEQLASELGRRAAIAVENARLHLESRQLNDELERRVEVRTSELADLNRDLEEQIRERQHAEAELRNRESQLKRAQRMTLLGSWTWRPATDELIWSEETYRIFGHNTDVAPSFDLYLITLAPEDRERVSAIISGALERAVPFTFEHAIVRPDGGRRYVRSEGEVTCDEQGNAVELFGTVLDITNVKANDEALRESEMRFRFLAEHALHIVATLERDGTVAYMSPSARQVLGYEPHRLVGRNCLELVHPDDTEAAERDFRTILDRPGVEQRLSYRYRHGRGAWRILEILGKLPDANSATIIINAHDITARVRADEEIRALNAELEQRSLQLSATNEELEAFAYSVSHDLRAPLRGIDGFSQALVEDYNDGLDETAKTYLDRIRSGAARMGELIDDLLDLSRLSRSKMVREEVDLSELAVYVGTELERRDPSRDVQLAVEPGMRVQGDSRLLTLLLENLLENAWKFTRKRKSARVEVGNTVHDGSTAFYVRDNGAGFDMTYADRLFGAFQRLHSQDEFEGTGIGLATVQRIVARHGGRIWAKGAVNKGATFYFTITPGGWQQVEV